MGCFCIIAHIVKQFFLSGYFPEDWRLQRGLSRFWVNAAVESTFILTDGKNWCSVTTVNSLLYVYITFCYALTGFLNVAAVTVTPSLWWTCLVLNASRRMVWNSCSSIPWMNSCSVTTINTSLYGRWFVPPNLIHYVIICLLF